MIQVFGAGLGILNLRLCIKGVELNGLPAIPSLKLLRRCLMRNFTCSNLVLTLSLSSLMAVNAQAFELNLIIDNISKQSGTLMIALVNSEASLPTKPQHLKH